MKVHFREQFGTKGNEVIYVTPAGNFCLLIFFFSPCPQHNFYFNLYYRSAINRLCSIKK